LRRSVSQHGQKGKKYASHSNSIGPDRRGRAALAGESFHPHGVEHQINLERCGGDLRGLVAPQRLWIVPFPFEYPCRLAKPTTERQAELSSSAMEK